MIYVYYFIARNIFRFKKIGKKVNLRLSSRFINEEYIVIEDNVTFSEDLIIAVYPDFAGVDNPVKNNGKGVYIGEGVKANRNIMIYCAEHIFIVY